MRAYRSVMTDVATEAGKEYRWEDEPTAVLGRTSTTPYGKNEWWWPSGAAV